MEQQEFQELQNELRAVAQMHRELAERMILLSGQIGKIVYEAFNHSKSNSNPYFPENDYGTIVTQINVNPNLKKKRGWRDWVITREVINVLVQLRRKLFR